MAPSVYHQRHQQQQQQQKARARILVSFVESRSISEKSEQVFRGDVETKGTDGIEDCWGSRCWWLENAGIIGEREANKERGRDLVNSDFSCRAALPEPMSISQTILHNSQGKL